MSINAEAAVDAILDAPSGLMGQTFARLAHEYVKGVEARASKTASFARPEPAVRNLGSFDVANGATPHISEARKAELRKLAFADGPIVMPDAPSPNAPASRTADPFAGVSPAEKARLLKLAKDAG